MSLDRIRQSKLPTSSPHQRVSETSLIRDAIAMAQPASEDTWKRVKDAFEEEEEQEQDD